MTTTSPFRRGGALLREAFASAASQPVASLLTLVIVAGMCGSVVLTTGKTVGAEQAILGSIDDAGTRSIIIRAQPDSGLDSSVLSRMEGVEGISWAGAFGPAVDVRNSAFPGGALTPLRLGWSSDLSTLGIQPINGSLERSAWASDMALSQLGMPVAAGSVHSGDGVDFSIVGGFEVPDYLASLEPAVVSPRPRAQPGDVAIVVVIADSPELVAPVSAAVLSILGVVDPAKITVTTSERLASLRALVEGQLGAFGRGLIFAISGVSAALVAAVLYGLVTLRRKDFGRRRALGASRALIVTLLLWQSALIAVAGSMLGIIASSLVLAASGDPLPDLAFLVAVGVLAIAVAVVAAVIPGITAARREPIRELRVP